MSTPAQLRAEAQRFSRLLRSINDERTRTLLEQMIAEREAEAVRLEEQPQSGSDINQRRH